jgi:hypothetical protein
VGERGSPSASTARPWRRSQRSRSRAARSTPGASAPDASS